MAGWTSNNAVLVAPAVANGVVAVNPQGTYTQLNGRELTSIDTETPAGGQPQSAAATMFQIAALAAAFSINTQTSTAGAATLNTVSGRITTEALTTAAGATYTFTLTNSLITAASPPPQVQLTYGTATNGNLVLTSVTNGSGNSVFVFTNIGTGALNGTVAIAFHI